MIDQAIIHLGAGRVVGIPTDTVYGIAVDPRLPEAVRRLFRIKARNADLPIGLLVPSLAAALEVVDLPAYARLWASLHWPGALNLIGRPRFAWPTGVGEADSLAVRVPDHEVALELLSAAGPLAVTSANRSGQTETHNDSQAASALGHEVAFYLPGESPGGLASTSVDVRSDKPILLRVGPIDLGF